MKICAIISEYNPMHSGHMYHIEKTKEITGADCIIAIMSGNFTQRGEPALFDKWMRAKCAVLGGANLVVELPFCFAAQTAQIFAEGAIKMADAMGCVELLSFGSETGDVAKLRRAAASVCDEELKIQLKSGKSYPSAVSKASGDDVFFPNNILGMEYIRAAEKYAKNLKIVTVKREGESYGADGAEGQFISAASCRRLIKEHDYLLLEKYMHPDVLKAVVEAICDGNCIDADLYGAVVLADAIRGRVTENTPYVGEGIENRILRMAGVSKDCFDLIENIKTKRYTHSRIRRILCNATVGITKDMLTACVEEGAKYLNVLAADETGYAALRDIKNTSKMHVISKHSDVEKLAGLQRKMAETDVLASAIYSSCKKSAALRGNAAEIRRGM